MDPVPPRLPVVGMEVDQSLLLFLTALAGGVFGDALGAARVHLHATNRDRTGTVFPPGRARSGSTLRTAPVGRWT